MALSYNVPCVARHHDREQSQSTGKNDVKSLHLATLYTQHVKAFANVLFVKTEDNNLN
jgi:hypothetical protein